MKSVESSIAKYEEAFKELPPLYQLRFYSDDIVIEMIDKAIKTGKRLTAEELESRIPDGSFY